MTVQQALRALKGESFVVSRHSSRVLAREHTGKSVGLRSHFEKGFETDEVSIDSLGRTAESLHGAIAEPLDKIHAGQLTPKSIRIRILVSDTTSSLALPAAVDGVERDSAAAQARMDLSTRYMGGVTGAVQEPAGLSLVPDATVENRRFSAAPMFEAYVINGVDAYFGYNPVVKHDVRTSGHQMSIYDPMGKNAVLFRRTDDDGIEVVDTQFVIETRYWLGSAWNSIAVADPT